jgi:tetratricopeptide (TPR) repeat protein
VYDLFLSLAGPDRPAARELCEALRRAGLRVFLDEDIRRFDPITAEIERALRSSRALLAYYSVNFTGRPACQLELTAAFLAGQRERDPMRRILVVNPEDPHVDHLLPAELADAKYVLLPVDRKDLKSLVRRIQERLAPLTGTLADVRFADRPRWFGRTAGEVGFVGRYREQWDLHSRLRAPDLPLTREPMAGAVVSLVGMPGIGKSALAAMYGWQFGAAYPGGVYWVSLAAAGGTGDEVLARYADEVRSVAETLSLAPGGASRERLFGMVADALYAKPGPSLWVVDDVPDGLDRGIVQRLVLPAGTAVRTVLVTHTDRYEPVASPVVLGSLTEADAGQLLWTFRAPAQDEMPAFRRLVERLGGHPLVVRLAGSHLRDREHLVSFEQYTDRLNQNPDALAVVADLVRDEIAHLAPAPRLVLQLAAACAPTGLPAPLVTAVTDRLRPTGSASGQVEDALVLLQQRALAARIDTGWQVHSLVLAAARRHLDPPVPAAELARTAAEVLDALAADPALPPMHRGAVIRHAEALAASPHLPTAVADGLLRGVAGYYEARGEPELAVRHRNRVADRNPDAAADQAAAAATAVAAGEYRAAVGRAARALETATRAADQPTAYRARQTLAEALDALSEYAEADRHWTALLDGARTPAGPVEAFSTRVGHLRALRLRGRMADVKRAAGELIGAAAGVGHPDDPAVHDAVQAAKLELARADVLTDGQRAARELAAEVIEHYRERGLPEHVRALEAQEVLAEAMLTLHLWELWPDKNNWVRAENELRQLRDSYQASHGTTNPLTLAASVRYAYALVSQGRRDQGRTELASLLPELARQLGDRHPLYLRAVFLRGLIFAQLQQHESARPLFEQALAGQRVVLGTRHAHTLRTQYELAVALKMTDDSAWHPKMVEVNRLAREAVGWENDLYTQSLIALGLLRLPTSAVRLITRFGRPKG